MKWSEWKPEKSEFPRWETYLFMKEKIDQLYVENARLETLYDKWHTIAANQADEIDELKAQLGVLKYQGQDK